MSTDRQPPRARHLPGCRPRMVVSCLPLPIPIIKTVMVSPFGDMSIVLDCGKYLFSKGIKENNRLRACPRRNLFVQNLRCLPSHRGHILEVLFEVDPVLQTRLNCEITALRKDRGVSHLAPPGNPLTAPAPQSGSSERRSNSRGPCKIHIRICNGPARGALWYTWNIGGFSFLFVTGRIF